jgi:CubicO group peptidase (beta-lactamase class C family)
MGKRMKEGSTRRSFLAGAAATVASVPLLTRAQQHSNGTAPLSDAFIKKLPQLMEWANVPGIAIATLKDGKPTWSRGFGVVKAGESSAVGADTLFGAASLSKPVFAYAILRMRDEKLIDLDKPLVEYLPNEDLPAGDNAKLMTARHALSHSSGLQNWRFARTDKLEFAFKPGDGFQYSGEGFYYLSRVLEKLTGRGFEEYMQERVFKPLGMTNSTYLWTTAAEARMSWGHNGRMRPTEAFNAQRGRQMFAIAEQWKKPVGSWRHEDVVRAQTETNKEASTFPNSLLPNCAGSLITSVDQYALFLGRLLKPHGDPLDLSPASRREMFTTQTKINSAISWGVGVGLENYSGRNHFWHWGDNGTFKAFMMGDIANGAGLVVFTNGQNGHKIWGRIVTEAMGSDHPATYFFMT